jgi:DNA-binding NarL/FixJ family response regulator
MADVIKVVIVDDHPLFRQGMRQLVESQSRFELVGEAGDGASALIMIEKLKPDVAVLDVSLPDVSGLELARKLQAKRHPTRIVILTMHNDEDTFNRAMDLGVRGFVLKDNAVQDIVSCLTAVAAGEPYLSPSISYYLVHRRGRADKLAAKKPGLEDLTKAERRVLKLISEKKTSREIAAELFVSPRTIEAHRANISGKLALSGSHSLLQFALENRSAL